MWIKHQVFLRQVEAQRKHRASWRWGVGPRCRVSPPVWSYVFERVRLCEQRSGLISLSLFFSSRPPIKSAKAANHSALRSTQPIKKSGGCVSKVIRLLLLALLAAALYYLYCYMKDSRENIDQAWMMHASTLFFRIRQVTSPLMSWGRWLFTVFFIILVNKS